MSERRRRKPLWRSEVFLLVVVLVLAVVAGFVSRQDLGPVLGPVLSGILLALAVVAAVLLVVPMFRRGRPDAESAYATLAGLDVVDLPDEVRVTVDDSRRRQTSLDAALARSGTELRAVLTPAATRWLGRELRVAVDLVADDGALHRVGFLPRDVDELWSERLDALAAHGAVARVRAVPRTTTRPYSVDVYLGPVPGAD
jgi:membrane protein implicated in regulation of membrane protease activity